MTILFLLWHIDIYTLWSHWSETLLLICYFTANNDLQQHISARNVSPPEKNNRNKLKEKKLKIKHYVGMESQKSNQTR